MVYIGNSFSLQMLPTFSQEWLTTEVAKIEVKEVSENMFYEIIRRKEPKSCIGHEDLANILGLPFNRESITLETGDHLLVAQLTGGRLPEGTKTLPEGFRLKYLLVSVM